MGDDEIWISNIFNDSTIVRGTDIDRSEPGWVALKERQSVSEEELPLNIYAHYKDETFHNLPPAFEGAGGLKLSAPIAAVLRQCDLGKAFLIPAQLYLYDRRTPIDKEYFIYASYERKEAFVPELSRDIRIFGARLARKMIRHAIGRCLGSRRTATSPFAKVRSKAPTCGWIPRCSVHSS